MDINIYYVGQANFSIITKDINALIYDCETSTISNWIKNNQFCQETENYFDVIFKEIKNFLIIISHTDIDHYNLIRYLIKYFKKKKITAYKLILKGNEKKIENILENYKDYFNTNSNSNSKIIIKSFVPPRNYKDNNENSIVLKLIGANW